MELLDEHRGSFTKTLYILVSENLPHLPLSTSTVTYLKVGGLMAPSKSGNAVPRPFVAYG